MDALVNIDVDSDVAAIARIEAVPTILDLVCQVTGLGFAAVARVTDERWVACSVKDEIGFGLVPGAELDLRSTLCHEVRECRRAVIIDHVAEDEVWRDHHTPAQYGFQSYISVPILLADGSFFGTLCAIDPKPAELRSPRVTAMFELLAQLIAFHLDSAAKEEASQAALLDARETATLREQFIAVLGHDLRNPLAAIEGGVRLLSRESLSERGQKIAALMQQSVARMSGLIDDVLDLARGRLGGGLPLARKRSELLGPVLDQVVAELRSAHPDRVIETDLVATSEPVDCDRSRLSQLFSNLIGNALTHGAPAQPVIVSAATRGDQFLFSVANSGDPIPPSVIERLFEPFSRGDLREGQQGLGLGLYIAWEIARAHRGTLEVKSTAQETRFTFQMPLT
jgi:signal transduction histidine kinase